MPAAQAGQNLLPQGRADEGRDDLLVGALLAAQLLDLVAQVLLGLADGNLVDALDVLLGAAPAAGLVAVALWWGGRRGECKHGFFVWKANITEEWKGTRRGGGSMSRANQTNPKPKPTFARFFRHSLQALGVTMPIPRFRLDPPPLPADTVTAVVLLLPGAEPSPLVTEPEAAGVGDGKPRLPAGVSASIPRRAGRCLIPTIPTISMIPTPVPFPFPVPVPIPGAAAVLRRQASSEELRACEERMLSASRGHGWEVGEQAKLGRRWERTD